MTFNQTRFNKEDLVLCGQGKLFGKENAQLPLPPILMFDRIVKINEEGGKNNLGYVIAELDITPDLWFFKCHFQGDPVMPGCLGLDAMWQLIGFYLGWLGLPGKGRALGASEIKFTAQVTPKAKKVIYRIDMKKVIKRSVNMGIADAKVYCDAQLIYQAKNLKVGLFKQEK